MDLEGLETMFNEMDTDGSGKLGRVEAKTVILKRYPDEEKATQIFVAIFAADTDGDHKVSWEELKTAFLKDES